MTLPFTISPMMQPTDQISTEKGRNKETWIHLKNHKDQCPNKMLGKHGVKSYSEDAETMDTHHSRNLNDKH